MLPSLDGRGPIYQQIYRSLRAAILSGALPPHTRLSSTRSLAQETGVSRNTVVIAYEQLLAEGYIVGQLGSGTFVAPEIPDVAHTVVERTRSANAADDVSAYDCSAYATRARRSPSPVMKPRGPAIRYDFRYGLPDLEAFPFDIWRKLLARHIRAAAGPLMYGAPEGSIRLREVITGYLRRARGVQCDPDQVVVVNGSQQALDLIARTLIDPDDVVVIENPNYLGAREVFLAAGARLAPGLVDEDGLNIDRLPPLARRARLIYVTPSHQFPTGAVMPLARRLALLAWAADHGSYVIEDDYDSEYRYAGRPIEAMQSLDRNGRVIYVGTLSKILFPALRLGYLVLPKPLTEVFRTIKYLSDRHTASLQQDVVTEFVAQGHFERHLRRTRKRNAQRRVALLRALEREFGDAVRVQGANAGLHLLAWFRNRAPEEAEEIVARAEQAGVGVYPVTPYYLDRPPAAGLVLGYAALNASDIDMGITRLAERLRWTGRDDSDTGSSP
jgi:GntR family transcriptional regulator / MocR family aminotransferase